MEESTKSVVEKTIKTEKGEVLTIAVTTVNTSLKKKIVQELLETMLSEIISSFRKK